MIHQAEAATRDSRLPDRGGAKWHILPVNILFLAISHQKLVLLLNAKLWGPPIAVLRIDNLTHVR